MGKFQDLTGKRFGKLTVLYRASKNDNQGKAVWMCQCDCGNTIAVRRASLKNGDNKGCGCAREDYIQRRHNKGIKSHCLGSLYTSIKTRCYDKNDVHYPRYGARGIKMANEWLLDFWKFADYMESLPHFSEKGYSIDRIDVNGDYEPGNVRWETNKTQARNRTNNKLVCAFGKIKTLAEWAEDYHINYYTLWSRIQKSGWTLEDALTRPIDKKKRSKTK